MTDQDVQLIIYIETNPKADIEDIEELTLKLRTALLEYDVGKIEEVRNENIPEHAKFAEPISWGVLLVKLTASGGVLTMLVKALQSWLKEYSQNSITIVDSDGNKITIKGNLLTLDMLQKLIEDFINNRHKKGS